MQSKACTKCGEVKDLSAFNKDKRASDGCSSSCKECFNAMRRASLTPEKRRQYKVKHTYGLTAKQYQAMKDEQGGKCAICHQSVEGELHVDHCHATGKVRGLLCLLCNTALGKLRDDETIIQNALDYVRIHKD